MDGRTGSSRRRRIEDGHVGRGGGHRAGQAVWVRLHIVGAYHQQAFRSEGVPPEFDFHLTGAASVDSLLDDVASRARVARVKVETHATKGDAADAIIDVAARLNAGVIVVGNKGIGSMRRFKLGNVPTNAVHNAPCSTYVVHTT